MAATPLVPICSYDEFPDHADEVEGVKVVKSSVTCTVGLLEPAVGTHMERKLKMLTTSAPRGCIWGYQLAGEAFSEMSIYK